MLFWIGILLIISSLSAIVFLIVRHGKQLRQLNLKDFQELKHAAKKIKLIDERFSRKLQEFAATAKKYSAPALDKARGMGSRMSEKLHDMEDRYKQQKLVRQSVSSDVEDQRERQEFLRSTTAECQSLLEEEEYAAVEKKCLEMITSDPRYIDAYFLLGESYRGQREMQSAIQSFEHAAKLLERKVQKDGSQEADIAQLSRALYEASRCAYDMGEFAQSAAHAQRALDVDPNNPRYLSGLFIAAIAAKDRMTADQALYKLRQVNPENEKIEEWEAELRAL